MRITALGWLAILTVVAGVLLILQSFNHSSEGARNAEDENLGA